MGACMSPVPHRGRAIRQALPHAPHLTLAMLKPMVNGESDLTVFPPLP